MPRLVIALVWVAVVVAGFFRDEMTPRSSSNRGWGAFVADYCWLRANVAWEARDAVALRNWITASLFVTPASQYFRLNAARMMAYDLPAWQSAAEPHAPAAVRRRWQTVAAEEAIDLLRQAVEWNSESVLITEAATIALYGKRDRELAAALFREAAEMRNAPSHAARIHVRLLGEMGRQEEAAVWLSNRWSPARAEESPAELPSRPP